MEQNCADFSENAVLFGFDGALAATKICCQIVVKQLKDFSATGYILLSVDCFAAKLVYFSLPLSPCTAS